MPVGGQLIKASGPAVYYMGMDGKRYVFPNEATYRTWYSDFSTVQTISDSELAQIMIGGNVTYRPGRRLVKITTDPKVYAVSGNGTLRWVKTEALAASLYGANWATQIDDVPDPFFINYHVGTAIENMSDYDHDRELSLSSTIEIDRGRTMTPVITPSTPSSTPSTTPSTSSSTTPTTPSTTSTPSTPSSSPIVTTPTSTLSFSNPNFQGTIALQGAQPIRSGATYTVFATPNPSGGITSIRIWDASGTAVTCEADYCAPRFVAPIVTATTTQMVTGVFRWAGPQYATSTINVTIAPTVLSDQITYTSPTTTVYQGNTREVRVHIGNLFSPRIVSVYMDGQLVKQCENDVLCTVTETERSEPGTQHTFYARAENSAGEIINGAPYTTRVISR